MVQARVSPRKNELDSFGHRPPVLTDWSCAKFRFTILHSTLSMAQCPRRPMLT